MTSGRCDLVADIRFPRDESELDLSAIVADIIDKVDKEIGTHLHPAIDRGKRIPGQRTLTRGALEVPKGWNVTEGEKGKKGMMLTPLFLPLEDDEEEEVEEKPGVSIDLDLRFKDLKASVPVSLTTCA